MTLAELSVRRPIGTVVFFIGVVLFGLVGLRELAIDLLPEVDMPRVTVVAEYEGVAPQDIETLITRPIEQSVSTVDGVSRIESTSSEGLSRVQLHFEWGMDLDEVVNDVRAQLDRARANLPEEIAPPVVYKFDLSSASVAHLGISGSGDARWLRYLAEEDITRRLEGVPGVAKVDVRGGRRREIRVELIRERVLALGIDASEVSAALARENRDVSAGDMLAGGEEVVVRTEAEYQNLREIEETVVAHREGRPIQVRDIAEVKDGIQEVRDQLWIDETPGIRLIVNKQSGANTMEVVQALRAEIEEINRDFEGRAQLSILRDSGKFIEDAVLGVQTAALLGGGLAIIVLFVFLRDLATTLVVATTIPISVMATFGLMYMGDITLNLVSFGGLALGVGMLVDNAIVIVENIHRKREEGLPPNDAAIVGTNEVAGAVTAGTLTTLAVFVPVVFLGGFAGVFFREMAIVVCCALACSLGVALTLVPTIAARTTRGRHHGTTARTATSRLDMKRTPLDRAYGRFLESVLRRPFGVVTVGCTLLLVAAALFPRLGSELMPETDEGRVSVSLELPVGTPLLSTSETMLEAARRVRSVLEEGELEHLVAVAGPEFWWKPAGSNDGSLEVLLVPASERTRGQDEIIAAIRGVLADLPGAEVRVRADTGNLLLRVMRGGSDDRLTVDVIGHDLATAERLAAEVRARAETIDGVTYTRTDRELGQLERSVRVDRTRLGELGLGAFEVARTLEHYVLGRVASRYREHGEEYDMRVVLRAAERERLEQLPDLPIALPTGGSVPLGQVASIEEHVGPSSLARENQNRILKIGIGVGERDLGAVVADLDRELHQIAAPAGFDLRIGGEFREQQETFSRLLLGGVLALFLVYAVMAIQFESLRGPMVVMAAIPFAIVGVIVALLATKTTLNMNSALGIIVLIGVVVNNAIVLVDHINQLRRERQMAVTTAVWSGAVDRLRPVLMTTLTTVLGLLPLAFALGEGSELQAPLGRAVVGGLSMSTLVTLAIVPCLYLLLERRRSADRP